MKSDNESLREMLKHKSDAEQQLKQQLFQHQQQQLEEEQRRHDLEDKRKRQEEQRRQDQQRQHQQHESVQEKIQQHVKEHPNSPLSLLASTNRAEASSDNADPLATTAATLASSIGFVWTKMRDVIYGHGPYIGTELRTDAYEFLERFAQRMRAMYSLFPDEVATELHRFGKRAIRRKADL